MTTFLKIIRLAALLALPNAAGAGEVGREYFCEDIKKPFFSVSRLPDGTAKVRAARPRALPSEFSMPKPEKTARVFIAGESAARLLSGGGDSLERFLGKAFTGKKVELINCGMGAYDSRRILPVLEEVLEYAPDLVIILSGNNETGRDFCPDLTTEYERRVRKIKTRLASLSLGREEAERTVSLAIHEERLRDMAALARKKGIPVLFVTLPANLRDFAPGGSPPEGLEEGIRLAAGKDPALALEFFRRGGEKPFEPFSLFYSGRALEASGKTGEALKSYAAAVKYDSSSDRCSGERNAMIRNVAAEKGACLADLEKSFSSIARGGITGGDELADGVHWFARYNAFVGSVIAGAAQACLFPDAKTPLPEPKPPARSANGPDEFKTILSYASAYAAGGGALINERAVIMLERLCRLDCGKLERLLFNEKALEKEIQENEWSPSLRKDAADWRPALLRSAAEMFLRAGRPAPAARAAAALPARAAAEAAGVPAEKTPAPASRPLREGEAEAKTLSDLAVKKMLEGDLPEAGKLLARAAEKDKDSLEIHMNACYLAGRTKDAAFGEKHCGEAVYLAAYPPKHAAPVPDGAALAFYSRAVFRLETGHQAACEDLGLALKKASTAWNSAAEARALAAKRCP